MNRHGVRCGDQADAGDPDEAWLVEGVSSSEAARDHACRCVRATVEDLRREAASPEALAALYRRRGEDAVTQGFDAGAWLSPCIASPATWRQDSDHAALERRP